MPVGGGGLASGVSAAVKAVRPRIAVYGVEPDLAPDARDSLAAGRIVAYTDEQRYATIADGMRTQVSELTLAHLRAHLDGIVTVTEDKIRAAVGRLARDAHLVAEPSARLASPPTASTPPNCPPDPRSPSSPAATSTQHCSPSWSANRAKPELPRCAGKL